MIMKWTIWTTSDTANPATIDEPRPTPRAGRFTLVTLLRFLLLLGFVIVAYLLFSITTAHADTTKSSYHTSTTHLGTLTVRPGADYASTGKLDNGTNHADGAKAKAKAEAEAKKAKAEAKAEANKAKAKARAEAKAEANKAKAKARAEAKAEANEAKAKARAEANRATTAAAPTRPTTTARPSNKGRPAVAAGPRVKTKGGVLIEHTEPRTDSPTLRRLANGTSLTLACRTTGHGRSWVKLARGGYLAADYVTGEGRLPTCPPAPHRSTPPKPATTHRATTPKSSDTTTGPRVKTKGGVLIEHTEPRTDSPTLRRLANGTSLTLACRTTGHGRSWVKLARGGYVAADYVTGEGRLPTCPPAPHRSTALAPPAPADRDPSPAAADHADAQPAAPGAPTADPPPANAVDPNSRETTLSGSGSLEQRMKTTKGSKITFGITGNAELTTGEKRENGFTTYTAKSDVSINLTGGVSKAATGVTGSFTTGVSSEYTLKVPDSAVRDPGGISPFDPSTMPVGSSVMMNGANYQGTELEASFRGIALKSNVTDASGVSTVIEKATTTTVRVTSGPTDVINN